MISLLKTLALKRVVKASKLPFDFHQGVVRVVDAKGSTLGVFLDKETLDDIEEELESTQPKFLASLAKSRASGRVHSDEVKRKAGLK